MAAYGNFQKYVGTLIYPANIIAMLLEKVCHSYHEIPSASARHPYEIWTAPKRVP